MFVDTIYYHTHYDKQVNIIKTFHSVSISLNGMRHLIPLLSPGTTFVSLPPDGRRTSGRTGDIG
jgi:hypothetical protein